MAGAFYMFWGRNEVFVDKIYEDLPKSLLFANMKTTNLLHVFTCSLSRTTIYYNYHNLIEEEILYAV